MSPSLLITGATGTIGSLLVRELAEQSVPVRALVRSRERARALLTLSTVDLVEGDLEEPTAIAAALSGITHIFVCTTPAPDQVILQGNVVEAAERTGRPIHLVTVSAVGAVPPDVPLQLAQWHRVTEAQIQSTNLPATILRPQFLMQNLLRVAPSIRTENMLCGSFHQARLPLVDAGDVAAVAAAVLTTDGHNGQSYTLTGPQALSYTEIAALFSNELGRPIRYVDMSADAYQEYLMSRKLPQWKVDDLTLLARSFQNGHTWPVTPSVAELTGRPARTLQQFIREHVATFRPPDASPPFHGTCLHCATPFWSLDAPPNRPALPR
jgi:uncharacterized protein YbjT (DUF2867 family)